jgi:hypothetical protein
MASLEVSALARAAAAWPPIGMTGCAPGHHPAAGQVPSAPAAPVRSQALPSVIPAGWPSAQPARGLAPHGSAATSCRINPCRPSGEDQCPTGGERTE